MRIINVHFGGTTFVFGTTAGNTLYCVKFDGSEPDIENIVLSEPPLLPSDVFPGAQFLVNCGSYFKVNLGSPEKPDYQPTFIICGSATESLVIDEQLAIEYKLRIYCSNDGSNWTEFAMNFSGRISAA